MTPLDFARALSDLMRDRVISAQRYLDDHRDLEQLGMPIEIVRHALDRRPVDTGPSLAVDEWDGKGLLGLHGALNNGKTHAAALWAHRQRRSGRRVLWVSCPGLLSFEALDRALSKAQRAPAVVLDDVGPGLGGTDGFRTKLSAWIQERGQLPTILTANAHTAQLEQYIGARMVSRLQQTGKLSHFGAEAGLREPDPERLDDEGRGRRWASCTWTVWRFGCDPDDTFDGQRVVQGHRVGDALETARLSLAELEALAMTCGVTVQAVEDQHEANERNLASTRALVAGWRPPALERQSTAMASIVEQADRDVKLEIAAQKIAEGNAGLKTHELGPAPEWTRENRPGLVKLGFRVDTLGDGFVVRRTAPRPKDSIRERPKAITLSPKLKTAPMAWDYAARLCGL